MILVEQSRTPSEEGAAFRSRSVYTQVSRLSFPAHLPADRVYVRPYNYLL